MKFLYTNTDNAVRNLIERYLKNIDDRISDKTEDHVNNR